MQRMHGSASHGAGSFQSPPHQGKPGGKPTKRHRALGGEMASLVEPVVEGPERQDETALQFI